MSVMHCILLVVHVLYVSTKAALTHIHCNYSDFRMTPTKLCTFSITYNIVFPSLNFLKAESEQSLIVFESKLERIPPHPIRRNVTDFTDKVNCQSRDCKKENYWSSLVALVRTFLIGRHDFDLRVKPG